MNAKQLKFLQLFTQFNGIAYNQCDAMKKLFISLINLDYGYAVDVWEYGLITYEDKITEDKKTEAFWCGSLLNLFFDKAGQRVIKSLTDNAVLRKAVYQLNSSVCTGIPFETLVNLLVLNKLADSEEIFKCLVKNVSAPEGYGLIMKTLLEKVFLELLKKNSGKRLEINKKLGTLLASYISKIKTDERAMLEQRLKEIM